MTLESIHLNFSTLVRIFNFISILNPIKMFLFAVKYYNNSKVMLHAWRIKNHVTFLWLLCILYSAIFFLIVLQLSFILNWIFIETFNQNSIFPEYNIYFVEDNLYEILDTYFALKMYLVFETTFLFIYSL